MSPSTATARAPRTTPAVPVRTGSLRLVPQRRSTAAKAPFVASIVSLLVVGLLGLLLLNTLVAQQSFRLHDLAKQGKALDQQEQALLTAVQGQSAPASLARQAAALGMVPAGPPLFLRLSDGKVLGAVAAADAKRHRTSSAATRRPPTTKTVTSKPVTTTPVLTKPITTQPVTTKPVTTTPVTTKPGTTKPAPTPPAHRSRP